MSFAIDTADYQGVRITCESGKWRIKIDQNHPELTGRVAEVALVIREPEVVLTRSRLPRSSPLRPAWP